MALFGRNRKWRGGYNRRNSNWDRYPRSYGKYRKHSIRWMLLDFSIRLLAFTLLCALGLAWVKFHFLDGMFPSSF
jgi:hypothetical protein